MHPPLNLRNPYPVGRLIEVPQRTYQIEADVHQRTLLLVDDDVELGQLLKDGLELQEFRVTAVSNAVDGLKRVMEGEFDLILCDMAMPHFPGDMFYRAVDRVRPKLCGRFLFMTGHRGDRQIDDFVRSIGGLLIWKPFTVQHLTEAMEVVLRKAQSKESASARGSRRHTHR
jgi:DNA-binding response OmpR family regulator